MLRTKPHASILQTKSLTLFQVKIMTTQTKTAEEIAELKRQWLNDACWDIWQTEGFEAHQEELKQFQNEQETKWEEQLKAQEQAERDKAKKHMLEIGLLWPQQYPIYKELKYLRERTTEYAHSIQALEYHVKKLTGISEL